MQIDKCESPQSKLFPNFTDGLVQQSRFVVTGPVGSQILDFPNNCCFSPVQLGITTPVHTHGYDGIQEIDSVFVVSVYPSAFHFSSDHCLCNGSICFYLVLDRY